VADKIRPSLRGARLSGTSLNGILILKDASLHGYSLRSTLLLASASDIF
jgi:hypothetical protein